MLLTEAGMLSAYAPHSRSLVAKYDEQDSLRCTVEVCTANFEDDT